MDNSQIHTAPNQRAESKNLVLRNNYQEGIWKQSLITTYAPMLNPIELAFCLFRQQTEKQIPRNFEEMEKSIEKVVKLLNTKDLRKYFWHCATYLDRKKETKTKLLKTITNF
ncbi:MAG: hypothetical protein MRERC_11c017 [Mycoplasmataceae bacterium RC_NB112A]|nr:MAG: hypothetical protein MRERC_11c017 [Mycoplasmataceae bacterium RC_NB112A]